MNRALVVCIGGAVLLGAGVAVGQARPPAPPDDLPTFRSAVDLVSVAAVVRDGRGQIVRRLQREDFQVLEAGVTRPIVEFAASDEGPVSIALLVDVSGSMAAAANLAAARRVVDHLLAWMQPGADEVALVTFDRELHENQPFTTDPARLRAALAALDAWGMTSMWDAIGETARRLQERPGKRRAVVVLTDGQDNASQVAPDRVSAVAIAADMPVYVVAVVPSIDRAGAGVHAAGKPGHVSPVAPGGPLANLTWWTGGSMFVASDDLQASDAARTLLAELRHQYLLAIEGSAGPGWRPLEVRLQRRGLKARARTGYYAALPRHAGS